MHNPFFSVIIPIYNVEKYVKNGIQNLLAQTFADFEAIFVDDGSTDSSGRILEELSVQDNRIRIIHQSNTGAGGARNHGICIAKGKYVCFYDTDDKISPIELETIANQLTLHSFPDILVFGYDETDRILGTTNVFKSENVECITNSDVAQIYPQYLSGINYNNGFAWNKAYRRDFLLVNKIEFGSQRIQQDEIFNIRAYYSVKTLVIIPDVLYHYFVYDKGNTRSTYIENRFEIYVSVKDSLLNLINHWQLKDKQLLRYVYKRFFFSIIGTIRFNCFHPKAPYTRKERLQEIRNIIFSEETKNCIDQLINFEIVPDEGIHLWYFRAIKRRNLSILLAVIKYDITMRRTKHLVRVFFRYVVRLYKQCNIIS